MLMKMMFCQKMIFGSVIYFSLSSILNVEAVWYDTREAKLGEISITATNEDEETKPITARSQSECVLKCKTRCKRKSFYTNNDKSCFCLQNDGDGVSKIREENQKKLGTLIKQMEPYENIKPPFKPKSCKELMSICPCCKSGLYEMEFNETTKVFCDLKTDGGGWLMVGGISFTDDSEATTVYNNYVKEKGQIKDLHKAAEGKFILESQSFAVLRDYTQYSEIRLFCYKPSHGRTVDIAITLDDQIYNFIQGTATSDFNYCGKSYRKLEDDNSLLSNTPCNEIISKGNQVWTGIEGAIMFKGGQYHILLKNSRMECDDFITSPAQWTYYVR